MKNKPPKKMSTFNFVRQGFPLSTRWLHFHTFWRLTIAGFFSAITVLRLVSEASNDILTILWYLVTAVLCISAFVKTRTLEPAGYHLNMILFAFNISVAAIMLVVAIVMIPTNTYFVSLATPLIPGAIVDICNVVYFKKRRALFFRQ